MRNGVLFRNCYGTENDLVSRLAKHLSGFTLGAVLYFVGAPALGADLNSEFPGHCCFAGLRERANNREATAVEVHINGTSPGLRESITSSAWSDWSGIGNNYGFVIDFATVSILLDVLDSIRAGNEPGVAVHLALVGSTAPNTHCYYDNLSHCSHSAAPGEAVKCA